ncbi:MAG: hypothetical protein ACTSU5_04605 [Promethearchaeota archaeon]
MPIDVYEQLAVTPNLIREKDLRRSIDELDEKFQVTTGSLVV